MYNETECQQMAQVATSSVLRSTLSVIFILCVLCLPVNLYALWRILISVKLHFNSKCILFLHNFFVLIHCVSRIALHGKDLYNYFDTWNSGCDIIPSRSRCELRVFYKYSTFIIEISPFVLMIERFAATFRVRDYENRYKWLGGILNILHLSLGFLFMFIQTSTNTGEVVIYYCWLANSGNRILVNVPTFFIFTSQFATIPGLLYLLKKNEINLNNIREVSLHKHSTLTERYQISENLRTSSMFRIMSAVTWVYVAYNAAASYAGQFIMNGMGFADQFATVEIIHCIPIYYIILSILIIRVDVKPRSEFVIKVNSCQTSYFAELQKFFDDAFEKINLRRNRVEPLQKTRTAGKLSSTGNRYLLNIPIFFVVFSQLITIPALLYLLKKNELNRDMSMNILSTLTQRYQIHENLRTLNMFRIMSVITWLYVTYNAAATFAVHFLLIHLDQAGQFGTIEIVHCLPLYFLILTVCILREDRKPHNRFVIQANNYEPHYFNGLQRFFDEAFEKINARTSKIAPIDAKPN
ncbi:unnamed protein product [Caenorhabditis brenneri]